jgi:hypothetical protein
VTLAGRYGIVEMDIPVLEVPLEDTTLVRLEKPSIASLESKTPMLFLGRDAFIFGTTEAFTTDISNIRNKFYIPHEDGAPNLPRVVQNMERWASDFKASGKALNTEIVILLPQDDIPFPIIIQTVDALKQSGLFGKVIFAGGLL